MSTTFDNCLAKIMSNETFLGTADERAVELVVILPLLKWAGWDTEDPKQIYPQKPLPSGGKVDYDLQIDGKSRVFIEVKSWRRDLNTENENQLRDYCKVGNPVMGILTNGSQWKFFLPPTRQHPNLREFLELDVTSDQVHRAHLEESFRHFLAKDSIQSIRSTLNAARALYDEHTKTANVIKGLKDAWNELSKDGERLKEVLMFLTRESDIQPDESQLEKFLASSGNLVNEVNERPSSGRGTRVMPRSFTLPAAGVTKPVTVTYWNQLTSAICILMNERHPDTFRNVVLGMPGTWFSESPNHGFPIGDTGIYCKWTSSDRFRNLCQSIVSHFRYPEDSLTIDERV